MEALRDMPRRGRGLSLRTLIVLRWLAVFGQTCAILVADILLHFPMPLWECLAVVGAGVVMNLITMARSRQGDGGLPDGPRTAAQLGFDILQLATLLALTGGLANPFCLLLVAPVTIAAAALPARQAIALSMMALFAVGCLFYWSLPLPWRMHEHLVLPLLYRFGLGLALMTGVLFTAGYAWKVAADAEKLELALATTQDILQREQRLAALGGLAAAAAHELGTPLATIQVVAKEMLRGADKDSPAFEDAALILQQAERCRRILKQLSDQPASGDPLYAEVELKALLQEVVEPHRGFDLDFTTAVKVPPGQTAPCVRRLPEVVHGLSTLVENAADFAKTKVRVTCTVDAGWIEVEILDDGPGFAPEILPRLGEPYVTSRPQSKIRRALADQIRASTQGRPAPATTSVAPSQGGMGLGFFIARTLLERSGGKVSVGAGEGEKGQPKGARVKIRWLRQDLEIPDSAF
jgi:two-component system sensor histidine kinase RegB